MRKTIIERTGESVIENTVLGSIIRKTRVSMIWCQRRAKYDERGAACKSRKEPSEPPYFQTIIRLSKSRSFRRNARPSDLETLMW
jgi:hypothetical protein